MQSGEVLRYAQDFACGLFPSLRSGSHARKPAQVRFPVALPNLPQPIDTPVLGGNLAHDFARAAGRQRAHRAREFLPTNLPTTPGSISYMSFMSFISSIHASRPSRARIAASFPSFERAL